MGFRLVPKSVTLNDLKLRNGRFLSYFTEFGQLWRPVTSKWLKIDLYCLRQKCSPKNLVFSDYAKLLIWRYSQRLHRTNTLGLLSVWSYIVDHS